MNTDAATACIERNTLFFLTAHETPDADAIGAECALYYGLRQIGKEVRILNADPTPRIFAFIDEENVVEVLGDNVDHGVVGESCLIVLDANDINNIGAVRQVILANASEYLIIDHHEEDGSLAKDNLIDGDASSTCEIIYHVLAGLGVEMTTTIAQALYAGIVYDTGSFIYPKTSAETFGIAQALVQAGVEPYSVYTKMYESNPVSSLRLQTLVMATLTLHIEDNVAVQRMTKEALSASGAAYEEGQTLINGPLKSAQIRVSVFFKENESGVLRCSLRSKGDIDVAAIATGFGGGGHRNAAGFKSGLPLVEMEAKVLELLARQLI
jgi:bifunctional oligoribonuclease and PAP phosphatase NrnA